MHTDLPVLSPFDEIEEISDQKLGDLAYIALPYRNFISQLGYSGEGWYGKAMGEHLLYHGKAQWRHITHRINATARIPQHALQEAVNTICGAWSAPEQAKFSINSLIGCLGIKKNAC